MEADGDDFSDFSDRNEEGKCFNSEIIMVDPAEFQFFRFQHLKSRSFVKRSQSSRNQNIGRTS